MQISEVVKLIEETRSKPPIETWRNYDIREIPFAVYEDDTVVYIGHPDPPQERPATLVAATSLTINGVETATVPVSMCVDAEKALPLAYHEGFHVFQHHHFAPMMPDMFTAMACYPDLDVEYRTLCALETAVLRRDDLSIERKLSILGFLTQQRRDRLKHHDSLLTFERFLERSEGTAFFTEARARQTHFGIAPQIADVGHGLTRFYITGAAVCWLLDSVGGAWMERVEQGESPGDLLLEYADNHVDLAALGYDVIRQQAAAQLEALQATIAPEIDQLERNDVIRIRYGTGETYRAFNPTTLVSLGDGRVLHRTMFKLMLPTGGSVAIDDAPVIDNVKAGELILCDVALTLDDGHLKGNASGTVVDLRGVRQVDERVYTLG